MDFNDKNNGKINLSPFLKKESSMKIEITISNERTDYE